MSDYERHTGELPGRVADICERPMRAVRLRPQGLTVEELQVPRPQGGEALVRVHAAAITRDELTWPAERLPAIPSYELSGVVAEVASDVRDVTSGDEVFALTPFDRDGVAAEYALVPAAVLAAKPRSLTHVESAALTLAGLSAWQGLFEHGELREDECVRVLAASAISPSNSPGSSSPPRTSRATSSSIRSAARRS